MGPLNTRSFRLCALAACHRYMTPGALNPWFMRSRFQTFHVNAITHQTLDSQSLKHNKAGPVFPLLRKWHLNFCNKYQPNPGAVWSLGTQATLGNCSGTVSPNTDSNRQQWPDGAAHTHTRTHTAAWHTHLPRNATSVQTFNKKVSKVNFQQLWNVNRGKTRAKKFRMNLEMNWEPV